MKSACKMPDLQMALLEAVRFGDVLDPEVALHADICDDCQAAALRLRRMTSVWVAENVAADSGAAISLAAARFAARSSRRKENSWQGPLRFAFVGALAAVALLVATRWIGSRTSSSVATSSPPAVGGAEPGRSLVRPSGAAEPNEGLDRSSRALAVPHVEGPRGVTPLVDGLRFELEEGESARVALANGKTKDLHGPCAIEFWSSSSEVGGWRLAPVAAATSGLVLDDPREAPPVPIEPPAAPADAPVPSKRGAADRAESSSRGNAPAADLPIADSLNGAARAPNAKTERAWARAAEAMRRDNFAAADEAFGELCHAPDVITRDKARLARAQLWIAYGRGADVRSVLVDLAANGANALVRERAAEFLSRQNP
jgi:hypothetical protein